MVIQIKKGKDGPDSLACVRADGSRTWSRLHSFFPAHDLTHYAVESVLGYDKAFFGLIAGGRDLGETERNLEPQALWAENIVGLFDRERLSGGLVSAAEFNQWLDQILSQQNVPRCPPVTEQQLQAIRDLRDGLHRRWGAIAAGETLAIPFPAG